MDCQSDCLEMDYTKVATAITPKTKAIIAVDIAGIPADYDTIYEIVESKKEMFKATGILQEHLGRIAVIADAAHSFGAVYKNKRTGSVADFSSFSFHAVKNLTTAEGGAVTWKDVPGVDNDWLYSQFMLWSLHGQNKDALAKSKANSWEYDIKLPGYKCNMTDIMAAIGLAQVERYDAMLARRKEIIKKYNEAFKDIDVSVLKHETHDYTSSGHLYLVRLNGKDTDFRNEAIAKMADYGVATNVHYKPLAMMTAYKALGFDIKDYPNAYNMYKNEITLPLHTLLTDDDVEYIIECFKEIVGNGTKEME